jgi:hypothetical protein
MAAGAGRVARSRAAVIGWIAMCPYDAPEEQRTPNQTYHPCEHCGVDDEPTHPVQSGGGILTLCAQCRSEVVGGS